MSGRSRWIEKEKKKKGGVGGKCNKTPSEYPAKEKGKKKMGVKQETNKIMLKEKGGRVKTLQAFVVKKEKGTKETKGETALGGRRFGAVEGREGKRPRSLFNFLSALPPFRERREKEGGEGKIKARTILFPWEEKKKKKTPPKKTTQGKVRRGGGKRWG